LILLTLGKMYLADGLFAAVRLVYSVWLLQYCGVRKL